MFYHLVEKWLASDGPVQEESLDGSIDMGGYVAGGGGIVLRDVTDDADKITVGVL